MSKEAALSESRRKVLVQSAKAAIACGLAVVEPSSVAASLNPGSMERISAQALKSVSIRKKSLSEEPWTMEQFQQEPELTSWRVLDSHDTAHITSGWSLPAHSLHHRLRLENAPDGKRSFCHMVRKHEIVRPVGIDSPGIKADFSSFSKVLMRYHHWLDEYSYIPGKWIGLQLGRGWVATSYVKRRSRRYGNDGCSSTTMHPSRPQLNGNGIRLLATNKDQQSEYGELVGDGLELLPTGRWLTIDVVIDRNLGHRLYVDGRAHAISPTVQPVSNWEGCRAIWYRTRLMHGGHPEKLPAISAYKEWFGGFFIAVA